MKYPNASKGMKILMTAEIIALAASLIALTLSVFGMPGIDSPEPIDYLSVSGISGIAVIGMYVAAYGMALFGIVRASRDEPAFKVSVYSIIAMIILAVPAAIFYENEPVFLAISIAGDVAQFFFVHYIIHGIMHLSEHLGRPELSKQGKGIFTVIYIGIFFEVIVRIIEIFYGMERGEELALPFDVAANILKTVEYIMFLTYIVKGNKLLKENNAG